MAFDEVRLSTEVEQGASGGPEFKTQVLTFQSGFEQRNEDWAEARGRWDVGYGIQDMDSAAAELTVRELIAFFRARKGRLRGFRFKDWSDFEVGDPNNPTLVFQQIGVGDGVAATFQAVKTYTSGSQTETRTLKKLVAGTVTVLVNGVVDGTAAVDVNTGVVTPTSVPALNDTVEIAAEFDVPVRFDADQLNITMQQARAGGIPRVEVVELRVA